jgi:hypothetical protein
MIKIYIKDEFNNILHGVVQIGTLADSTFDGVGTFTLEKGIYKARGMVHGYRVKQQEINVEYDGQEFTLLAVRG